MKEKMYIILFVVTIAMILSINIGCKKETIESKPQELKEQAKVEETSAPKALKKDFSYNTSKISFGTAQGYSFLRSGWSGNGKDVKENKTYNWALGESASIYLALPKKQSKLAANVKTPLAKGKQTVTVKVDGQEVGTWTNENQWKWEKHTVIIGPDENRPKVSVIEFVFSKHLEPNEKDKRPLALLFEAITIQ